MAKTRSNCTKQSGLEAKTGRKWLSILIGGLSVVSLCVVVRYYWGAAPASAEPVSQANTLAPQETPSPNAENSTGHSIPPVVATVNSQRITREDLGRECLRHNGREVLESMVNKQLIIQECQRRGVVVTQREVNAEIGKMAARFKIPVEQWLKLLKQERNITPDQYTNDIIWPMIALRKLAGDQLTVSQADLVAEYESRFGEAIRARLIAVSDSNLAKAKDLHAKAVANPENFGNLAKQNSEDTDSASVKGMINPIRKHGSFEEIEKAVFNMRDGEISPILHVGGQYVFLQR